VSFFCPAARGDAPVSSFPLADRGGIGWNLGGGRVGCRPGDRVAASSKVQRASPSARVREPMGACISASRTRQVAGSIPVEPSQLPDLGGLVYTPAMRCGLYCPAAGKPVWSSYQPNHTYFSCPVIINQGERYHRAVLPHPNWHHVVQIPTGAHLFLGTLLTLIILLFDLSPPPPPLPNEKFPP